MGIQQPYQLQKLILYAVLAASSVIGQLDLIVDFKINSDDIFKGMDIVITCQVSEFNPNTDNLQIQRTVNGVFMPLANHLGSVFSTENIAFEDFTNNTLRLTFSDVQISYSGVYTCVASRRTGTTTSIGLGLRDLQITVQDSNPPVGQLQCSILSEHSNLVLNNGEMLQLACSSSVGRPQVELQWSSTGNIVIPETVPFLSDQAPSVLSPLTLEVESSFDGVNFTCTRQSKLFPSSDDSCFLGPFAVPMSTMTTVNISQPINSAGNQTVIIASTVTVTVVCILLLAVLIYVLLIRSGRFPFKIAQTAKKTKPKSSENSPIEITTINGRHSAAKEDSHDNPVAVEHVIAPNGGAEYAIINKKNSQDLSAMTTSSNKNQNKYPTPPNYPRPPKSRESTEHEQYANTGLKSSDLLTEIRNVIKTPASEDHSEAPAYANTSDATLSRSRQSAPSELLAMGDQTETPMYANTSDATLSRRSAPSGLQGFDNDVENEQKEVPMYANAPMGNDGERLPPIYDGAHAVEGPLYADASTVVNTKLHLPVSKTESIHFPAPDVAPPPPPQDLEEPKVDHTPELEYADLDLGNVSLEVSNGVSKPTNRESVLYSSIA